MGRLSVGTTQLCDEYLRLNAKYAYGKGVDAVFELLKENERIFYELSVAYSKLVRGE